MLLLFHSTHSFDRSASLIDVAALDFVCMTKNGLLMIEDNRLVFLSFLLSLSPMFIDDVNVQERKRERDALSCPNIVCTNRMKDNHFVIHICTHRDVLLEARSSSSVAIRGSEMMLITNLAADGSFTCNEPPFVCLRPNSSGG